MTTLWSATVSRIGEEAAVMIDAGVLILFGDPVPDALADVSIVHQGATQPVRALAPGDRFEVGTQTWTIDEVGERATANLTELGHVVFYINQPDQDLLPGAIKATGPELTFPESGTQLAFIGD